MIINSIEIVILMLTICYCVDGGNDNKRIRTTLINLVSTEEAEEDEEDVVVIPDTKRDRSGSLDEEARFAGDAYIRDIEYQDVDNEDAGRDDDFVYGHEADADDDDNNQEDEDDDCAGDCRLYYEKHIVALDGDEVDAEDVSSSLRYERRYHEPIDSASDSDGAEANVPAKKSPYSDDDEDDDFGSFESLLQTRMTSSTAYASASEEEDH